MVYCFLRDYNEYDSKWAGKTMTLPDYLAYFPIKHKVDIYYHKMQNILCTQCLF